MLRRQLPMLIGVAAVLLTGREVAGGKAPQAALGARAERKDGKGVAVSWIAFLSTWTGKKVTGWPAGSRKAPDAAVADLFVVQPDGSGEKQLSDDHAIWRSSGVWAPDAPRLAWAGEKGLMVTDLAQGTEQVLLPGTYSDWAWGPRGDRLAVLSDGQGWLRVYDLTGRQLAEWRGPEARVVRFAKLAWSSQGALAVYLRKSSEVWVTTDAVQLAAWRAIPLGWPIAGLGWSPDGKRLLLVDAPETEDYPRIWMASADGSNLRPLHAHSTGPEEVPVISPDGTMVAYVVGTHGKERAHVGALDGSWDRDLTPADAWAYHPTWSPDSTRVAFAAHPPGVRRIYIADVATGTATQLTSSSDDFEPVWSPAY